MTPRRCGRLSSGTIIARRQGCARRHDALGAGHGVKQLNQRRLTFQNDARSLGGDALYEAHELEAVACALLGVHEQGASGEGLARPKRRREWACRVVRPAPAPFVFGEAGGVIALQEQGESQGPMGLGKVGLELQGPPEASDCLVDVPGGAQRIAEV